MTSTETIPEPYEGVVGTLRDEDDMLSLEDKAMPVRAAMMAMAWNSSMATLRYRDEWHSRIGSPEIGDLVVETSRGITTLRRGLEHKAFGYLIAHRVEWAQTNAEREAYLEANPDELDNDDDRWQDHAWYVQYGPQPEDVCRWTNCSFIAAAASLDFKPAKRQT